MSRVRALFMGTPEIAAYCLEKMLADEHFEIVGVVSQPDRPAGRKMQLTPSPVKAMALQHNLRVMTPEKVNDEGVLAALASLKAEVVVVVAFGQIVSQKFLDQYPLKVVNVHASLLPRWRGAAPIQRAIMAGDKETGVCLQVMVKKLDAGAILGTRRIAITDEMDALSLHEEMKTWAADLLAVELMDYVRGNLAALPQDESQVTLAPKIEKSEGLVDWKLSAREIFNRLRGLQLGPGAFTVRDGKRLKLIKVVPLDSGKANAQPGTVLEVAGDSFVVACGVDSLRVTEVQPESKGAMPAAEYLRGHALHIGEQFK